MRSVGVNVAGGLEAMFSFSSSDRFVEVTDSQIFSESAGAAFKRRHRLL